MEDVKPYTVLGLDPGIASCGFCLLDTANHKILEMGVHLFDAPQKDNTKVSLAVARRNARSIRRNNERTKNRQKHCLRLLVQAGLLPEDATKSSLQSRKGDKPLLKLRAVGLDRPLSDRELSQVLYSLSGRRGYIPHGVGRLDKAGTGSDAGDDGKVIKAVNENSKLLREGGYRTVGEMLYKHGSSRNKGGNYEHCVLNSQIVDEVHALFEAQRSMGNAKATEQLEKDYVECLCWEKKSLDHDERVYQLVGPCSYFPEEKRAANADVTSELCRAYERLNHITIVRENGDTEKLPVEVRDQCLGILFSPVKVKGHAGGKFTYSQLRKELDLSPKDYFKGIDPEREKKEELFAPKAWRALLKAGMPSELLQRMLDDRHLGDAICEALTYASSEASLEARLENLDLSEEDVEAILAVPFAGKNFKGYGSRSLKALEMLLDSFEDAGVITLTEAEDSSGLLGLRMSEHGVRGTTLPPYNVYDPTCNNPVVLRAMGRMRRIVNAIIKIHGVPDEIHIELGRELKFSQHEQAQIHKRQNKNKQNNEELAEVAAKILNIDPSEVKGKVIRKLALRAEQCEKDVYTNDSIELRRLVLEDNYCEIDHVLPYSRTCNDRNNNKVLVLARSNQNKKERTPYEWMTSGEAGAPDWDEFQARVLDNPRLFRKRRNLLNTNLGPEQEAEFINRNLNDDRYMSRAVKKYLEDSLLFPEDGRKKHVIAVAGGATGNLRWVWGLNTGSNNTKDRSDDRHHAVDAAVIAACSEATVKKVADARSLGRNTFKQVRQSRLADTQPWPEFAVEVLARREFVVPTRMVNHGVTGRAFEDTIYRFEGFNPKGYAQASVRKGDTRTMKNEGNVVISEDLKSVQLVDGMAFLRLWLDPEGNKGAGKWYAEPVYYADIPSISSMHYTPRTVVRDKPRINWPIVPASARGSSSISLFRGDILVANGHIGRFWSINISTSRLDIRHVVTGERLRDFPTINSWRNDSIIKTVSPDCLGHLFKNVDVSTTSSQFQEKSVI